MSHGEYNPPLRGVVRSIAHHHCSIACALGAAVAAAALAFGVHTAGGADSYGYISQADLWLKGQLHLSQDFARDAPWPSARWTFTPLGYRPDPDGWTIVPWYPPNLPLLMAAAKWAAGERALYGIVPMCAGLLVLATYAIGHSLERPMLGLAAAWLIATSPIVGYTVMWPMSDVPAAAFSATAIALVLRETPRAAAAGGLAAGLAILVRPNLVPLAGLLGVWLLGRDLVEHRWRSPRLVQSARFVVPATCGILFVAGFNARLYGSPFETGYIHASTLFNTANITTNLRRYSSWLVSSESWLAPAGLIALVVPWRRLWRGAAPARAHGLLAGCVGVVWASYLAFLQFDAWWYLRYLLPSWPMMAIGLAAALGLLFHGRTRWQPVVAMTLLVGLGAVGVARTVRLNPLTLADGEAKYAEVARVVRRLTPPDAVVFSQQHSGTLRYYGGRMTLRWEQMDLEWLDRSVAWLDDHGHPPYLLLEDWEADELQRQYDGNVIARLDWQPIAMFQHGTIKLYDAVRRDAVAPPLVVPPARRGWPSPVAPPRFRRQ